MRQILHIDQDAFFVSVELRKNPSLAGKPVIIGGNSIRGVVASASYEARKYGVHSAMASKLAVKLCPHAIFIKGNHAEYSAASSEVTKILVDNAPLVEKASIDEHYVDLTGVEKYYGTMRLARELRQKIIKETQLPVSFGLSINKTVAKMATNACKPNGELEVQKDAIEAFLSPQPIGNIPGLGKATEAEFNKMGVYTIAQLMALPDTVLSARFGKHGIKFKQRMMGHEGGELQPYHEQKSMSTQRTFSEDIKDIALLERVLHGMLSGLAYDLRQDKKLCGCVAVIIKYNNFEVVNLQQTIPYTSLDTAMAPVVKSLLRKLYDVRRPVRLAGVRLSNLIYGSEQADLYGNTGKNIQLYERVDQLRNKFGKGVVLPANTIGLKKKG